MNGVPRVHTAVHSRACRPLDVREASIEPEGSRVSPEGETPAQRAQRVRGIDDTDSAVCQIEHGHDGRRLARCPGTVDHNFNG